ncbi:sulfate permease [Reichenbachiella agarivorans]|uniref:Sulfate permease n=1 Tax=Reichenbachiella agarivorans TaxID=2979464 RepID=A0ABY6CJC5_9BACT|nr:sulfate permease [Reichenbachiella agarivorans]UXP30621.1 sulfate permease [Reichenbachiella agarivorans]
MEKLFPIIATLRNYHKSHLKGDLTAGLIVGILLVPQGMAYAMIAGLPPVYGLYAAIFPQIVYALFGSSRQLAVGPVAMDSLLVATGVSALAAAGSDHYIELAVLLALMIGMIQLTMGLFRLGFLTNFLSRPVITGFTIAAVLIIMVNQLKYLTGVDLSRSKYLHEIIVELISKTSDINWYSFAIGVSGVLLTLVLRKISPKVPASLVLVVLGSLVVYFFHLETIGVSIIGFVPKGIPSVQVPTWTWYQIQSLLPTAITLAIIGFIEAYSLAQAVQVNHKNEYEVKSNRELIALGMGNMIGSMFSSFTTTGGFSRTAVNDAAGAKTTLALIFSAMVVLSVLMFMTGLFYYLPHAALAAIIIMAVAGLIKVEEVKRLWKTDRYDFVMMLVALGGTIMLGIEWGIGLGVVISLIVLIYKTSTPHIAELGQIEGTHTFRNLERFKNAQDRPEIGILRFDARLYFANTVALREKIDEMLAKKTEMKLFVLDAQSIGDVDSSGMETLHRIYENLNQRGIQFKLAAVIGPVRDKLYRSGLVSQIGLHNFHESIESAIGIIPKEEIPFQTNVSGV